MALAMSLYEETGNTKGNTLSLQLRPITFLITQIRFSICRHTRNGTPPPSRITQIKQKDVCAFIYELRSFIFIYISKLGSLKTTEPASVAFYTGGGTKLNEIGSNNQNIVVFSLKYVMKADV